jgi:hypothetical protein
MSTLNVTNIAGPSNTGTAATLSSINGGPISGARNRIINGNFDIWQRGTSTGSWVAPITNYYWADRWVANSSGTGGAGSLSQQAFTPGQTDVPGEPTFFQRWQITSAASGQTAGNCWIEQRIEDVRTLAGQTATLSFYAKGTGTLPNIFATQTFGSGGSTQVAYTLASNVVLSSTWTKYTYTVSLASISGKTIGTNHYVGITFMVPLNTTYTFDLAQVQFEPGAVATPFERRSYGQELSLCQRYFETSFDGVAVGTAGNTASCLFHVNINVSDFYSYGPCQYQQQKRATPTVTIYSPLNGATGVLYNLSTNSNVGNAGVASVGTRGFRLFCSNSAMSPVNSAHAIHYTASAEL